MGYSAWDCKESETTEQLTLQGFPGGSVGKESTRNADVGSVPESGRFPGEGNGNPLQYVCLGNPMDTKSLVGYTVHGVARVRQDLTTKTPVIYEI